MALQLVQGLPPSDKTSPRSVRVSLALKRLPQPSAHLLLQLQQTLSQRVHVLSQPVHALLQLWKRLLQVQQGLQQL